MSLQVTVQSATHLPNVNVFSKSDPMCRVIFRGIPKETKVIKNNLNPEWNETLDPPWEVSDPLMPHEVLQVGVYDQEGKAFRPLGFLDVSLRELAAGSRLELAVDEKLGKGKEGVKLKKDPKKARIQMMVKYRPPPRPPPPATTSVVGGTRGVKTGRVSEGEGETGDTEEGNKHRSRRRKRSRYKLSTRPIEFQVRVHVIEGRKLEGGSVSAAVKILCGSDSQEVPAVKGTSNPYFNHTVFFTFCERPSKLLDYVVEFRVVNSKSFRKDALIGSFKFDLNLVYSEPEHSFIHKWLLLTDPKDPSGTPKGYLKISIMVVGPGDELKHSPAFVSPEDVDIEDNLLLPFGVQLEPATLTLKIYQAQDLPQMDPDLRLKKLLHFGSVPKKELVDPYCTVFYAGHTGRTEVKREDEDPEWNHEMNLGVRFPSMVERIQFQLMDWDGLLNADDFIGTCYLKMSEISAQVEDGGFLPTFGPSFINIYGSPREFSDLPNKYEYLNKGLFEGVAYRGRLMVELEMTPNKLPEKSDLGKPLRMDKKLEDKLTVLFRPQKFHLLAVFFSATIVTPSHSPVEFEISIGKCGYRVGEEELMLRHSTPKKNPVYDGNAYYFLSFEDRKPVVDLDCEWEDCLFRLEATNVLHFIADELERGLDAVREMLKEAGRSGDKTEVETQLKKVLSDFLDLLTRQELLPKLPSGRFTKLDNKLRGFRERELVGSKPRNGEEKIHPDPLEAITPTTVPCHHHLGEDSMKDGVEHLLSCWQSHTTELVMDECRDYVCRLRELAIDPQSSIPDVIIWMLSGGKRVAVHRIPAHKLMYFDTAMKKGKECGEFQTIFLKPPAVETEEELKDATDGAQLRTMLWLGREEDFSPNQRPELSNRIAIFAECYEHQHHFFGWPGDDDSSSSSWTDSSGDVKLHSRDDFKEPEGWMWEGDWVMSPELSADFNPEGGADKWEDEIFEYQHRSTPISRWDTPEESHWRDVHGEQLVQYEKSGEEMKKHYLSKDDLPCPKGWVCEAWEVDTSTRKVDKDGWEYSVAAGLSKWANSMKRYHLTRRRRWTRKRKLDPSISVQDTLRESITRYPENGWEYAKARLPGITYHVQEHWTDTTRQRRWLRKLVRDSSSKVSLPPRPFFKLGDKEDIPRMYLSFEKKEDRRFYKLLVHLYQARGMYASDFSGLSDPYAVVSFDRYSQNSRRASHTVSPLWEETLVFRNIEMYGEQSLVFQSLPHVVIEFFDRNVLEDNVYLGRAMCSPSIPGKKAKLEWYDITRYNKPAGELLAAFEFMEETIEELTWSKSHSPDGKEYYPILDTIRPEMQEMMIEVLCWGLRDMRMRKLFHTIRPFVQVECSFTMKTTTVIENAKQNPNFPHDPQCLKLYLPKNELYAPPLNFHVYDKIKFGLTPLVGSHSIKSIHNPDYHPDTQAHGPHRKERTSSSISLTGDTIEFGPDDDTEAPKDQQFDWWSKYYFSHRKGERHLRKNVQQGYRKAGYDRLKIIDHELEKEYCLSDLLTTFPLFHGRGSQDADDIPIGYLKGALRISPLDGSTSTKHSAFSTFPSSDPVELIVRVYIVEGIDLQPKDLDSSSDPYIKVKIGHNEIDDVDNHIPGQLNPVFGRCFELPAKLPIDHTLCITVMDWDRATANDVIGTTTVDLEDRYLTRLHATCGLPEKYFKSGPFKWRDSKLPWEILVKQCADRMLGAPTWDADTKEIKMEDRVEPYRLDFETGHQSKDLGEDKQRLALQILRTKEWGLVWEHVETRTLYHPLHPDISQGALRMWVDVFGKNQNVPPPVDIVPRQAEPFVLRIVVWNVEGVPLKDDSIFGDEMSDIFVKGWLEGQEKHQKTDVHYRSLDGSGNFNYRFVFPFDYKQSEQTIVVRKKKHFYSLAKTENEYPPKVALQAWDNDIFKSNDYLGNIEFMLTAMPQPSKDVRHCTLDQLREYNPRARQIDLFKQKIARGWWPLYTREKPEEDDEEEEEKQCCGCLSCMNSAKKAYTLIEEKLPLLGMDHPDAPEEPTLRQAGCIELEMEILTEAEAELQAAGKGRKEPNMHPKLEEPQRPATSFLWITSPWKSFRYIVWKHWKWYIILGVVIILLVLVAALIVYTFPSTFAGWMVNTVVP